MGRAKQNSAYIKPNDGRRNNGRKKGEKYGSKAKTLIKTSAQLTPAKKERISTYALNAMN